MRSQSGPGAALDVEGVRVHLQHAETGRQRVSGLPPGPPGDSVVLIQAATDLEGCNDQNRIRSRREPLFAPCQVADVDGAFGGLDPQGRQARWQRRPVLGGRTRRSACSISRDLGRSCRMQFHTLQHCCLAREQPGHAHVLMQSCGKNISSPAVPTRAQGATGTSIRAASAHGAASGGTAAGPWGRPCGAMQHCISVPRESAA